MIENWPGRGFYRGNKQAMVADAVRFGGLVLSAPVSPEEPPPEVPAPRVPPAIVDTLTSVELARQQGFTGDICSNCGGGHMQIAGHCMVCADCGTTTGCS